MNEELERLTSIPAARWEAYSDDEPHAVFCMWEGRGWRVERVEEDPETWEVEIRASALGSNQRIGIWSASTMADAVKLAKEGATP